MAERNELGRVACKLPLPPGTLSTLYKAEDRFLDAYFNTFPGYYDTCDAGIIDEQGYIHILARDDDVINVAGHRLSTSALEEVVLKVLFNHLINVQLRPLTLKRLFEVICRSFLSFEAI